MLWGVLTFLLLGEVIIDVVGVLTFLLLGEVINDVVRGVNLHASR